MTIKQGFVLLDVLPGTFDTTVDKIQLYYFGKIVYRSCRYGNWYFVDCYSNSNRRR